METLFNINGLSAALLIGLAGGAYVAGLRFAWYMVSGLRQKHLARKQAMPRRWVSEPAAARLQATSTGKPA